MCVLAICKNICDQNHNFSGIIWFLCVDNLSSFIQLTSFWIFKHISQKKKKCSFVISNIEKVIGWHSESEYISTNSSNRTAEHGASIKIFLIIILIEFCYWIFFNDKLRARVDLIQMENNSLDFMLLSTSRVSSFIHFRAIFALNHKQFRVKVQYW